MELTDAQFEDLLYLYALDALEPDELQAVEAYLETHPHARARVADAAAVTTLLAWTPDQHEPPPELRSRVLDRVAHAAQREQAVGGVARGVDTEPLAPDTEPFANTPSWWQRLGAALRAPAARGGLALSGALLAVTLVLGARTWQLQRDVAALAAQVDRQQAVIDLVGSPNVRVASIRPPDAPNGPRVQGLFDTNGQRMYVVASNLPQLPPNQTYQFWLIGQQPESGGLFNVDAQGNGSLLVQSDQPISQYAQVGVSREPAGGSATPTTDAIVLLGPIPPQ